MKFEGLYSEKSQSLPEVDRQRAANRHTSKTRASIEHLFGIKRNREICASVICDLCANESGGGQGTLIETTNTDPSVVRLKTGWYTLLSVHMRTNHELFASNWRKVST